MKILLLIGIVLFSSCVKSQNNETTATLVGGPCEGCEAIYEYGTKLLNPIDTLTGFIEAKEKLKIIGTIFKKDGKTPAKNVLLYAYQTNEKGIYPSTKMAKGWERRHGTIRGWVKTDASGTFTFYTFRPASYPNTTIEQHIHLTVKEPDKNEYYITDITFEDDPNLSAKTRNNKRPRAGNGIVKLKKEGHLQIAKRDIILGLNIPDYK